MNLRVATKQLHLWKGFLMTGFRLSRFGMRVLFCLPLLFAMGCSPVDYARDLPLGAKIPDKHVPGLLRSSIGAGSLETGLCPFPWMEGYKSCQLLTDERGVIVAKSYQAEAIFDIIPPLVQVRKTRFVLEAQIPPEWRNAATRWPEKIVVNRGHPWERRQEIASARPEQAREMLLKWEKEASMQPDKSVHAYLLFAAGQLQCVPAGMAGGAKSKANEVLASNYVLDQMEWTVLSWCFKEKVQEPILKDGATWTCRRDDGRRIELRNLGDGNFRLTFEQAKFAEGSVVSGMEVLMHPGLWGLWGLWSP
jgi:hypothetical protein